MKWIKNDNGTLYATGESAGILFTRIDLENGLKLLDEKPIFIVDTIRANIQGLRFQKHTNGVVYYSYFDAPIGGWPTIDNSWFGNQWHYPEVFETYAKALRS